MSVALWWCSDVKTKIVHAGTRFCRSSSGLIKVFQPVQIAASGCKSESHYGRLSYKSESVVTAELKQDQNMKYLFSFFFFFPVKYVQSKTKEGGKTRQ